MFFGHLLVIVVRHILVIVVGHILVKVIVVGHILVVVAGHILVIVAGHILVIVFWVHTGHCCRAYTGHCFSGIYWSLLSGIYWSLLVKERMMPYGVQAASLFGLWDKLNLWGRIGKSGLVNSRTQNPTPTVSTAAGKLLNIFNILSQTGNVTLKSEDIELTR